MTDLAQCEPLTFMRECERVPSVWMTSPASLC